MKKYQIIYADPPWSYEEFCQIHSKAGRVVKPLPYGAMSVESICALPVRDIADSNARLFLWTTNRYLPDAFRVMESWGFSYKQTIVWSKKGNPSPWGGSVAPNHAEFLLVGTVGKPKRNAMLKTNVVEHNVSRHSKKPELFRDLIVEACGDVAKIELFARNKVFGWDCWGNEVGSDIEL